MRLASSALISQPIQRPKGLLVFTATLRNSASRRWLFPT